MSTTGRSSGNCGSFGWLWLTDLHWGQHSQGWLWPVWGAEFFRDVARLYALSGPWQAVLFTGDLVFSGKRSEFDGLTPLLRRLVDWLSERQAEPFLLSIPGNHDLQRPEATKAESAALRHYWKDPITQRALWNEPESDIRKWIERAFSEYTNWVNANGFLRPPDYVPGLLPGDFSATLTDGQAKLGIIGLNTTFLQLEGGDYKAKLDVHPNQLQAVCGGDAPSWIDQRHVTFLLTHQPQDWLAPASRELFRRTIYTTQTFAAHFHGHMHDRADLMIAEGGAAPRRHFQGCSLFGLERYGDNLDLERARFGYAAGRLEVNSDRALLYLWPRIGQSQQSGDDRLVPDTTASLQPGSEHLPPIEMTLRLLCGPLPTNVTASVNTPSVLLASPAPSLDPAEQFRGQQRAIEARVAQLREAVPPLQPDEYLRQAEPLSAEYFVIGSVRQAWTTLHGVFFSHHQSLQTDECISLGLQLAQYLLKDGLPAMAATVLSIITSASDLLPGSDQRKAQFWQLQSECLIALSVPDQAVAALTRAIDVTHDPRLNAQLWADLAELYYLHGDLLTARDTVFPRES